MHAPSRACIAVAAAATLTCSSPTQPTDLKPPDFIVATGTNVLAVGGAARLAVTAFTRSSDPNAYVDGVKQTTDVSDVVTWSSDKSEVATIHADEVVGQASGSANLTASYLGKTYTLPVHVIAPSPLAQQAAGTWSGVVRWTCVDVIGDTRSCYSLFNPVPTAITEAASMTLTNHSGILYGSLDLGGGSFTHETGAVTAGFDDTAHLLVGGTLLIRDPDPGEQVPTQLLDWRLLVSASGLTGSGRSDSAWVNIYGPVLHRTTYQEITLQ